MKLTKFLIYFSFLALPACVNEDPLLTVKADADPAVITTAPDALNTVVTEDNLANEIVISWNKPGYGIDTEVKYTVEADVDCNNFSAPVTLGTTTDTSFPITVEVLNSKLLTDLNLSQHLSSNVSIRVTSTIKDQFARTSEPVTFSITPWNAWERGLWLISSEWGDDDAPAIHASTASAYEGYVYLDSEKSFRFADKRTCDKTMLGGTAGQLLQNSTDVIAAPSTGYYRIKANTQDLTYELTKIESFGVIGTATPGSWGSSTPMTYDAARQVWEVTVDLAAGALKFRANDAWTINYGPSNSNELEGTVLLDDPGAINIPEPGNYTVKFDVSRTKSPDLSYSVTKNSPDVAPAMLWVPGEYQGWNPGAAPTIKALNESVFEGYVNITAPTGYKFTSAPDWNHINYGDAGTPGTLTTDGLANGMGLAVAGVYKFNVNVTNLTYSAVLINSMGMVGPATAGGSDAGWGTSVPMNYNAAEDVWTATINLAPGALKFRANNEWTINYGPADINALEGVLIFDDPDAINIAEAGNYTVTVDFSRSESPYKYTYKVVKN